MITSPVPRTSQAIIRYPPFVIPTEAEGSAVLQFHPTSIAFKRKVRSLLRLRLKGCPNPLPSASPHSTHLRCTSCKPAVVYSPGAHVFDPPKTACQGPIS